MTRLQRKQRRRWIAAFVVAQVVAATVSIAIVLNY